MWLILVSLLVGMIGVVTTRIAIGHLAADGSERDPHVFWSLGVVSLVPAWLIVLSWLLGPSPAPRKELLSAASWILSTASALIGAIATERLVRRASESEQCPPPARYWRLGVLAFVPAWAIALVAQALKSARD